jgi:hypothetical protein
MSKKAWGQHITAPKGHEYKKEEKTK